MDFFVDETFYVIWLDRDESELQRSKNITLIDEDISGFWEHTLAIPCYQSIVKEIINKYRR